MDGHPGNFSYWNNTIAVGSGEDIIILSVITGSQTAVLSGHTDQVESVTYSPDGISLVSGSYDETVKLWDMQTGGVVKTFYGHTRFIASVSISADCTRIASGSWDCTIRLWDIETGVCQCVIEQETSVERVSFHPTDPQHLLSICNDKVWQWDINGHQVGPTHDWSCAVFSPDGIQFVSCYERAVVVQNYSSGVVIAEFQIPNDSILHCCFSPDGKLIAAVIGTTIHIWDITGLEPHLIETFTAHKMYINSLAFSSPSSLVSISIDRLIKFWQISAPSSPVMTHPKSTFPTLNEIGSITLQAKDGIIITSDLYGVVKTWDILTGLCRRSFQAPVTFNKYDQTNEMTLYNQDVQLINGRLIIVWYADQKINAWDVESGELLFAVDEPNELIGLKILGDGSRIFCNYEGFIQALSVQTGEIVGKANVNDILYGSLTTDGSKVWGYTLGWDFGTLGSLPVQLPNIPPDRLHPNDTMLWDTDLCRIEDTVTGKVVFQLSKRYGKPVDVQWNGQYLVACFLPVEVLILDFSHIL